MNDIEDMYVLKLQGKVENLQGNLQYDFINSLLLFIRHRIIRARVEDVQLGAECYQTELNLTAPENQTPSRYEMRPYTFYKKPFGVAYKWEGSTYFMKYEEMEKYGDETLRMVMVALMEKLEKYNQEIDVGWGQRDSREARKFIARIKYRLVFRSHIRTLESLIGAREPIPNILTY